jgi:hypothetical protein
VAAYGRVKVGRGHLSEVARSLRLNPTGGSSSFFAGQSRRSPEIRTRRAPQRPAQASHLTTRSRSSCPTRPMSRASSRHRRLPHRSHRCVGLPRFRFPACPSPPRRPRRRHLAIVSSSSHEKKDFLSS